MDDLLGVYPPLTPQQADAVAKLGAEVDAVKAVPPSFQWWLAHHRTLFLAKWLTARRWVVKDAAEMYRGAAEWRLKEELDTAPLFPPACIVRGYDVAALQECQGAGERPCDQEVDQMSKQLFKVYSTGWHKWDKEGRPVVYERIGLAHVRGIVDRCTKMTPPGGDISRPIAAFHVHSNEVGHLLLKYQNERRAAEGKPHVSQFSVVFDCSGLTMGHYYGPALDLLKANADLDQKYYPEGMHRLFVANAPTIAKFGWQLVRPWLDKNLQQKIVFLKPSETTAALTAEIGAENLPPFLGGTCDCADGCVPGLADAGETEGEAPEVTEEFHVKAGGVEKRILPLAAGSSAAWDFVTVGKHIKFVVRFDPVVGSVTTPMPASPATEQPAAETVVVEDAKAAKHSGTFAAPTDGNLVLHFDNTASWMTGKTIRVHLRPE